MGLEVPPYRHSNIGEKAVEKYLTHLKFYTSGFEKSPFGIEWIRLEDNCPLRELVKTVPHVAFEEENLDEELKRSHFKILTQPNAPISGVRVAMIEHNRAPVELIEFS